MSINTALSGLSAAQHDIAATSHNIANVGTIGFRGSRAEFADVFNSSPYSISRTAVGSGVQTLRTAMQFSQGSVVATGNTLDLAIEGQGFFATEPAVGPNSAKPEPIYTRAGAFGLNAQGVAVNASGQKLLAWPVSVEGDALSQVPGSATPLTIPLTMGSPVATSTVALSVDLPTDDAMLGKQAAVPPAAAFDPADPTTYAAVTAVPIFDAKGNAVEAAAYFIKTANPTPGNPQTGWAVRLVVAGEPLTPAQGDLTFDATGALSGGTGALSFTAASGIGYTLDLTETEPRRPELRGQYREPGRQERLGPDQPRGGCERHGLGRLRRGQPGRHGAGGARDLRQPAGAAPARGLGVRGHGRFRPAGGRHGGRFRLRDHPGRRAGTCQRGPHRGASSISSPRSATIKPRPRRWRPRTRSCRRS